MVGTQPPSPAAGTISIIGFVHASVIPAGWRNGPVPPLRREGHLSCKEYPFEAKGLAIDIVENS
ncbi:MAG TPA: hypothetical protein VL101_09445, partial [Nordella sp.]|nr:hypothetical protein [Nordella sp.]